MNYHKSSIIVKFDIDGTHRYPAAPSEVRFLANEHRHKFMFEVEISVTHDDRELEFILVGKKLKRLTERLFDIYAVIHEDLPEELLMKFAGRTFSCEHLAVAIIRIVHSVYGRRKVSVRVFEDGENGVLVKC